MLIIYPYLLSAALATAASALATSVARQAASAQITTAPDAHEVELRRRGWIYHYYYPDYTLWTTCGNIPYSIGTLASATPVRLDEAG